MPERKKHSKPLTGYKTDSKAFLTQIPILGGKGLIYTTPRSGGNWYFRTYITESRKYFRQSLRTKDKEDALVKGENLMVDILGKMSQGHKLFGMKWEEVCADFLTDSVERVKDKYITPERLGTLTTQVNKWIVPYFHKTVSDGHSTLCSELDRNSAYDYGRFRKRATDGEVQDITIRNEYTTINAICKYAYRKSWLPFEKFNRPEIKIKEVVRRDTFTIEEYKLFYTRLRKWVSESADEHEKHMRQMMRDFIFIKSNTFMRFGEIVNLKWHMCKTYTYKGQRLIELELPATICKNRKSRRILTNGGQYLDRLKTYSKWVDKDDYVFSNPNENKRLVKDTFYKYWYAIIKYTGADKLRNPKGGYKHLTFYALRHLGITFRLMSGVSIYEVSVIAGTEVRHIENHYSHLDITKMKDTALKTFRTTQDGEVIPIAKDERLLVKDIHKSY